MQQVRDIATIGAIRYWQANCDTLKDYNMTSLILISNHSERTALWHPYFEPRVAHVESDQVPWLKPELSWTFRVGPMWQLAICGLG